MTTGDAKANPYSPPAHASVASPERALRPDERAYLSQLLACRNGIPPIGLAMLGVLSRPAKATAAAGAGAAVLGVATGVLLELTPGQLFGVLFVLFLCIAGTMAYGGIATVRRSYALWEVASRIYDYSIARDMLGTGRLLRHEDGSANMPRIDGEPRS